VLALDVVGYSSLMNEDETGTLAALIECRREIVEPNTSKFSGRIVKLMGDGALLEFASVVDAVDCGISIQKAFAARNSDLPDNNAIWLRIGINLGDIIVEDGDIYGSGVNVAARLETIADPGGVCISGTVFDQVKGKIEIGFEDLGLQQLKNIADPVRVYGVTADSGAATPPLPSHIQERPSIAILPLDDLSGEEEQKNFCDAVAEDLTTALSRFDWLFVAARTASFAYRSSKIDIKRIGRELGVRYVLEGSVRQIGKKVRVNIQLVDTENLGHHWADRFDREMDDPFQLQDEFVAAIASTAAPEIIQAEIARSRLKAPKSFDAWDHYLRAVDHYHAMTANDIERAIPHLEEAVKLDPQFAAAYGLRSLCEANAAARGWHRPVKVAFQLSERFAELAVRLSPTSPETNEALAFVMLCTGRSQEAQLVAQRSVELNPYYARSHAVLGHVLLCLGNLEGALIACEEALRSTPRDRRGSWLFDALGHIYFFNGQYQRAIEVSNEALHNDPSLFGSLVTLACANAQLGQLEEAQQAVNRLVAYIPGFSVKAVRKNPMFSDPDFIEKLVESLRLAGLPEK
jgi:TolB-like protein/class 3 adenylate cyclase